MHAIIETGGKQFRVSTGDIINVEKLNANPGDTLTVDKVLAIGGDSPVFGAPYVSGATVSAEVLEQGLAKKIIVYKYKPKKGFHKKKGHRQPFTKIRIDAINV